MIDTLRINLSDAEIKKSTPLQVQPPILDYSTGKSLNNNDLFIDNHGKIITGAKAFLNDEKFNLTINPTLESELQEESNRSKIKPKRFRRISELQPDLYDYNYRDEEQVKGIFVQTSLPRLLNQNNFKTLTKDQEVEALKILELKLKNYGITTDILKANLSRLDTFTNIKTDHIFFCYSNLFSLMECSRMKSIGWGDESFLWKNGQQELMIYDKIKEMKIKDPGARTGRAKNIMRLENRLLKKRKIQTALKLVTVEDLIDSYDTVKDFHVKQVEKNIFKYSFDDIELMTEMDLRKKFIRAKQIYGKKWFYGYCFNLGVWTVSKSCDIDFMKELIEELDEGTNNQIRTKKSRIKKALEEAKFLFSPGGVFSDEAINFKSNVELYNEIKTKFYRIAA